MRRTVPVKALSRRGFLQAAGAGFLAALGPEARAQAAQAEALFAAAFSRRAGGHGVAVLSETGRVLHAVDLPDRGHDIACDPTSSRAVVFARQPGTFALLFDREGRAKPRLIAAAEGRHFFGHGAFSPDGRLLYATENDFDAARGVVGVYDVAAGFERIGEFATGGVGPHELLLLPDGRTLAVANGGIETHPDYGRAKLNLATMQPTLAFIDRETGDMLENHRLPPALHQLSIRHMDWDAAGTVWFGCQHEGPSTERPALVGRARRGEDLSLLTLPDEALAGLRNYVGSVAANRRAGTLAVTSPEGNALLVIETVTGRLVEQRSLREVCGIAPAGTGFVATTGLGDVVEADGEAHATPDRAWDNHVLRLG